MQTHQQIWKMFQQHNVARFVVKTTVVAILGLLSLGAMPGMYVPLAQAHACPGGDRIYRVVRGDTLWRIGERFGVSLATLRSHNYIANPNLIYVNQMLCISKRGSGGSTSTGRNTRYSGGARNVSSHIPTYRVRQPFSLRIMHVVG